MEMKDELKKLALMKAEKEAKEAVDFAFELLEVVVKHSENKLDDALMMTLKDMAKEGLKELADKIHEEE